MGAEAKLLIVYASQSGGAARMAEAVERGACAEAGSVVRKVHGTDATLEDLLWCDALVIATPENFGYMAGAIKDFFDRTYYPAQERVTRLPYAVVVKAGHDGTFAVSAVERIARGYGFHKVAEPILCVGELTEERLAQCEELGQLLAAGISLGVFGRSRPLPPDDQSTK
jgi:multimeric flavodoxin WrbA